MKGRYLWISPFQDWFIEGKEPGQSSIDNNMAVKQHANSDERHRKTAKCLLRGICIPT